MHPAIFEGYLDGTLLTTLAERTKAYLAENVTGLSPEEAAVTAFLRLRLGELGRERKEREPLRPVRREGRAHSFALSPNQLN